jgi:large subunit ribosomal protein LP1
MKVLKLLYITITQADKIQKIINAAGLDVEPIWATIFAKALDGKNLGDFLFNIGSAGPAAAPAAGGASAAAAAETKEEEAPAAAEKEESDDDMGFDLFG